MANIFQWSDDYLIGNDEVDQQHRQLFELFNELYFCDDVTRLQAVLMQVYRYTREHFAIEEQLMKSLNYPDYVQHQQLHNDLITSLNQRAEKIVNDPIHRVEFVNFLANWLIRHIYQEDLKIKEYINSKCLP